MFKERERETEKEKEKTGQRVLRLAVAHSLVLRGRKSSSLTHLTPCEVHLTLIHLASTHEKIGNSCITYNRVKSNPGSKEVDSDAGSAQMSFHRVLANSSLNSYAFALTSPGRGKM